MEYYSTINGNEMLMHATSLMKLENNNTKWKKADTKGCTMYDSIYKKKKIPRLEEFIRTESRWVIHRGWEELGMENDCFIDTGVLVIHSQPFTCLLDYLSVCMLSCLRLFATPWTVVHQDPLSMGFSRQACWSELAFTPPRDLSGPGIKPESPVSSALAGRFFTTVPPEMQTVLGELLNLSGHEFPYL